MNAIPVTRGMIRPLLIDAAALLLIYFIPSLAHLLAVPVYMIEPMRLALVVAMVHTSKRNALLLAATLPFFSLMVSGHPMALKALIIAIELVLNVALYYYLAGKTGNRFLAMAMAIVSSKTACYLLYWVLFSWAFVVAESEPVFLAAQVVTTLIFSIYALLIRKEQK